MFLVPILYFRLIKIYSTLSDVMQTLLGIGIFLLPGLLWSYILSPKLDGVQRVVYAVLLSVSIATIGGVALTLFGVFTGMWFWLMLAAIATVTFVYMRYSMRKGHASSVMYQTQWQSDVWYILGLSVFGTIWKVWFFKSLIRLNDPYEYAFSFVGKTVPDLGFFTGMATDRVEYIGLTVLSRIQQWVFGSSLTVQCLVITFVFCGLVYLIAKAYRGSRMFALCVTALLCVGPVELFYTLTSIGGHSLAYVCILPMFLLFKNPYNRLVATLCIALTCVMISMYYTATIMLILLSGGFVIATVIQGLMQKQKTFDKKKLLVFACVGLIASGSILTDAARTAFSFGKLADSTDVRNAFHALYTSDSLEVDEAGETFRARDNTIYRDPSFLGVSAIRFQMLFFFVCGLTYIAHIAYMIRRRKVILSEYVDIGLALIPVTIVSISFFYVNYPTRIFDYFAFFGLTALCIPRKTYRIFFICAALYIGITSIYVARDKRVFLQTSSGEVQAAQGIAYRDLGVVFTDIVLANQIILNGYYAVTGADDKDSVVYDLFFQRNEQKFLQSLKYLHDQDVLYIAITRRMMDSYILMVNYPQKPMINEDLYEHLLEKVYDNGFVRVYSTDVSDTKIKTD